MSPWEFLNQRQSVPSRLLGEPGPSEAELVALIELAVRVPDHGKLTPWRFIRIAGDSRAILGQRLAAMLIERDAETSEAALRKERERFTRSPLVIVVVACLTAGHKVPESEQRLSAGLAAYNLLLGAQALGFGGQWLTGWPAYDLEVAALLGLDSHECVVSFIYLGSPREQLPDRPRPSAAARLRDIAL